MGVPLTLAYRRAYWRLHQQARRDRVNGCTQRRRRAALARIRTAVVAGRLTLAVGIRRFERIAPRL